MQLAYSKPGSANKALNMRMAQTKVLFYSLYGLLFFEVFFFLSFSSYMKAAKVGEDINIEAKLVKVGRNLAFLNVDITNQDGTMLSQGQHIKFIGWSSSHLIDVNFIK